MDQTFINIYFNLISFSFNQHMKCMLISKKFLEAETLAFALEAMFCDLSLAASAIWENP